LVVVCFLKQSTIAVKPVRPARFAVSTSTYSCRIVKCCSAAYPRRSLSWAGIEKPSFSCSLEETRAYMTAVGRYCTSDLRTISPLDGRADQKPQSLACSYPSFPAPLLWSAAVLLSPQPLSDIRTGTPACHQYLSQPSTLYCHSVGSASV